MALGVIACLPHAAAAAALLEPPAKRLYPADLPTGLPGRVANPGSVLVAFRTPVTARGARIERDGRGTASDQEVADLDRALAGLGAVSVDHLFTNVPAARLDAARARAEAATHAYVTDFTQVYQVRFDPGVSPGLAADRLAASPLVSAAMPDWAFRTLGRDPAALTEDAVRRALRAPRARAAAAVPGPAATGLPANFAYRRDAQSYDDAASDDVTGAASMLASRFGQQPGQGEIVTNVSLGTIDDTSTVLEGGQRYLEQAGYPKIPVWLSSQTCTAAPGGGRSCSVALDPAGTNTADGQGDLIEVMLDFSVMAPPPLGDPRVVNPPPAGLGEILGSAYGAGYRLINPAVNNTPNFFAAFLGAAFLQAPAADVITASIGEGFAIGGFSDYFFEQDAMIHDVVSLLVNGADVFVTISAGDGQTAPEVAMSPDGITGPTEVTTDPARITDINDPRAWADPSYSYALTPAPQYVLDSGAADAGGDTLNDVFANVPWDWPGSPLVGHAQHTTETRWTGQQNFHSGSGSRVDVSAPADDVLILAQVERAGVPVDPVATFPRLIGGTSASSPEIAAGAAIVRQAARLLGQSLTARQVRDLLARTGRPSLAPDFDLDRANVGPQLDVTRAVQALFDRAGVAAAPSFVRMTVAERRAVLTPTDLRSSFWSDTAQDPVARTATIDLGQGLVAPSSRTDETVGPSGDNVFAPITLAVDAANLPAGRAAFTWTLRLGARSATVPRRLFDPRLPTVRLLPSEIFGLLGAPPTATVDRTVTVTARSGFASITMAVTFRGQADATHAHAVPPSFAPVFQPVAGAGLRVGFDLRGVRDGAGGQVDGGVLLVSDIDRAVPQAFPDHDLDAHGIKVPLAGVAGAVTLPVSDFPHGAGTYGLALRGTSGGREVADSTSFWLPLRYAPASAGRPGIPLVQASASLLNGSAPLFYDIADTEAARGSTRFAVTFDVRPVPGARGALIELSAPTVDFASALYFTGRFTAANRFVNNFTNPDGDRLDSGDRLGQPGETAHVAVAGTAGVAALDGAAIGLAVPAGGCDSTYGVRVFATDGAGRLIGAAGDPALLSYGDFSRPACY